MADEKNEIIKFINRMKKETKKRAEDKKKNNKHQIGSCYDFLFGNDSQNISHKDIILFLLDVNKNIRFPTSERDYYLVLFLGAEIKPKLTLKEACDTNHPIAFETLIDLGIEQSEVSEIVQYVKLHSGDCLSYFQLFENAIDLDDFSMSGIVILAEKIVGDGKYGTVISHSSKMTSPACKFPKIYFDSATRRADGLMRSGNVIADFDLHIDASKLKVFKFLNLPFEQSTLFQKLKEGDFESLQLIFGIDNTTAKAWHEKLQVCITSQDYRTHDLIKQVLFPVDDDYHQLSLLQSSSLVFKLKERVDQINSRSVDAYLGRKYYKDGKYYASGYKSIPNVTVTRHGGEHPKNISGLNNKFQSCYLLDSSPPFIAKREIKFPTKNFFIQSLRYYDCKESLQRFDKILKIERDGQIPLDKIRKGRDRCLGDILDLILQKMMALREVSTQQFWPKTTSLPVWQQIWLCEQYKEQRSDEDEWLDRVCDNISRWVSGAYKNYVKNPVLLGEAERAYITGYINDNREVMR